MLFTLYSLYISKLVLSVDSVSYSTVGNVGVRRSKYLTANFYVRSSLCGAACLNLEASKSPFSKHYTELKSEDLQQPEPE